MKVFDAQHLLVKLIMRSMRVCSQKLPHLSQVSPAQTIFEQTSTLQKFLPTQHLSMTLFIEVMPSLPYFMTVFYSMKVFVNAAPFNDTLLKNFSQVLPIF
jgi:hypothetical protein